MPQEQTTLLDYLRHGKPLGGSRYRGHGIDDPLSETGWQQMQGSTAGIDSWQRVISSPMQRCTAFAERIAASRSLPLEIVDDLKEVGFGSWEGVSRKELKANRAAEYRAFHEDPVNNRPEGAESLEAFGARVAQVFDDLVDNYAGEHLLVVAHAGVIRATLGHVTQAPAINWYRAEVDNAGITRFAHDPSGSRLLVHNWRPGL